MTARELFGRFPTTSGMVSGRLRLEAGRIAAIEAAIDVDGPLIVPGFIDLHCHGAGGADVMDGGEAVRRTAETHAKTGTTAFLPTTMTASIAEIETALAAAERIRADWRAGEARVLGVHLEGPFISPAKLGAQPDMAMNGDVAVMERLLAIAAIRVVTCAPEADPDGMLARFLGERGVRTQIGHTACDYDTAKRALANGFAGVTHLFNAMSPFSHRTPGAIGAALAHADHAELIIDLIHVHPGALRTAMRAIPFIHAVTDACAAAGMPDGTYHLGRQTVYRRGGSVRLADGTLAGSCLTMVEAFRNMIEIGVDETDAVRRTSTNAADYLGIGDMGRIAVGALADLCVLDKDLRLTDVLIDGRSIAG